MNELIAGTIAAPKDLPADAVGSVGTPNTLPADNAASVGTPNTVPSDSAGIIAAPIALPSQGAAALPRSLTPMVDFDFAAKRYAQDGVAVAFEDIFTYTRASSATFTNRRLKKGGGYEYFLDTDYVGDVTNLLTYSEDFAGSGWIKSDVTANANAIKSPSGLLDATLINPVDGSTVQHEFRQNYSFVSGTTYTYSIFAKAGETKGLSIVLKSIAFPNTSRVIYNLSSGRISSNPDLLDVDIKPVGDGWFLLSYTRTATVTTNDNVDIELYNNASSYNSNGETGVYVWGAQFTESTRQLPYVKTLDVAVTKTFAETLRTEYDAVTGKNLGALIEGGSTNLCTDSESMGATGWATGNQDTVLQNVKNAPDGTLSMNSITSGATVGSSYIRRDLTLTAGVTYTVSIYASSNDTFTTGNVIKVVSPNNGTLATVSLVSAQLTNKVKRYSATFTVLTTQTHYFYFAVDSNANTTIEVWGAQIEIQPSATSYIRTEGSAVSRSADNLTLPSAGNFDANEYTLQIDYNLIPRSDRQYMLIVSGVTIDTAVMIGIEPDDKIRYRGRLEGTDEYLIYSPVTTSGAHIAVTTSVNNNVSGYYDGVLMGTAINVSSSANVSDISIGHWVGLTSGRYYGHVSKVSIYAQALTQQEITLL